MARRYRERSRTSLEFTITRLELSIKRMHGQDTQNYQRRRQAEKQQTAANKLYRRVYQTGEWWLLPDLYQQLQAKAYFTIMRSH